MIPENVMPEESHEARQSRHLRVVVTRKMEERRVFMEELKDDRQGKSKHIYYLIKREIGPKWYQVLSVGQREGLNSLSLSIYKDVLAGTPVECENVVRRLGIHPLPRRDVLMDCANFGTEDPKVFLARLFLILYDKDYFDPLDSYTFNGKLILSSIFYLGLQNLKELLSETFKAEPAEPKPQPKLPKRKTKELKSPYLQKMVAKCFERPKHKRTAPDPLPALDAMNQPYKKPVSVRKPPPPPPPPPPKKVLPLGYCAKLAGIVDITPKRPETEEPAPVELDKKSTKAKKLTKQTAEKKQQSQHYGKRNKKKRKPKIPPHSENTEFLISGVFTIHGRTVFVLGSISQLPLREGYMIHGGHMSIGKEMINIHLGIRPFPAEPEVTCNCAETWNDNIVEYLKSSKCTCGHHYDFGYSQTSFRSDEVPFFEKPTHYRGYKFNYDDIFELDMRVMQMRKDMKKFWDTDSFLGDKELIELKRRLRLQKQRETEACLGTAPTPKTYLKCALRLYDSNIAAKLPDAHLTPELREWMRHRIYGPLTKQEKQQLLAKRAVFWDLLKTLEHNGYGSVPIKNHPEYREKTTWAKKSSLSKNYNKFFLKYRLDLFRAKAKMNNMLWATMYTAAFPDKSFRGTFFAYVADRMADFHMVNPYNPAAMEKGLPSDRRYRCCPKGVSDLPSES